MSDMTIQNAIHCMKAMICEEVCEECDYYGKTGTDHCEADAVRMAIKALEEQLERNKGHWIKEPWHSDYVRQCSACHVTQTVTTYRGIVNFKFCPYCGADMRGESE